MPAAPQDPHQLHPYSLFSLLGPGPFTSSEHQGSGELPAASLWWINWAALGFDPVFSDLFCPSIHLLGISPYLPLPGYGKQRSMLFWLLKYSKI